MTVKIDKKITGYSVVKDDVVEPAPVKAKLEQLNESMARPAKLVGATYKLKTPLSDHALYITINDVILNQGTEDESRHPFEIFINSKNMDHFQWIVALTRITSAIFRKGGDVQFLVEELKAVFDPKGGYIKRGGKYMPSLVAEIGDIIEQHLTHSGIIKKTEMDSSQKEFLAKKRAEYETKGDPAGAQSGEFPASAQICPKCNTKAMIKLDGCMTCLCCGDSKCG